MSDNLATDAQKSQLQDRVVALVNDTYQVTIEPATVKSKRYLTNDNHFIYLTYSHVSTAEVAPVKIQIYRRVPGGVEEAIYRLYTDMRFERENNDMIFGQAPTSSDTGKRQQVTEGEAADLCTMLDHLSSDNERLQWGDKPGGGGGDATYGLDHGAVKS